MLILALALHMHLNYQLIYDFGKDKIVKSPLSNFRLVLFCLRLNFVYWLILRQTHFYLHWLALTEQANRINGLFPFWETKQRLLNTSTCCCYDRNCYVWVCEAAASEEELASLYLANLTFTIYTRLKSLTLLVISDNKRWAAAPLSWCWNAQDEKLFFFPH